MGSPLSGLLADIYLNHFENNHLFTAKNKLRNKIMLYKRYVDDTLVIFDGSIRQLENLLNYMNSIEERMKFTLEIEKECCLNFLDLSLIKQNGRLVYKIYRKETATDTIIHADSHHPTSHKYAAFNSYIHRMLTVPLSQEDYEKELRVIKQIAISNGYTSGLIEKLLEKQIRKKKCKNINTKLTSAFNDSRVNKRFVATEYNVLLPGILRNEFAKNGITVAFRTTNNLEKIFRKQRKTAIRDTTGVYKISCSDCDKFYVGQTGRTVSGRFKEHLPTKDIRTCKSKFGQHLMKEGHKYVSLEDNLKILHKCSKGKYMNAIEEYEIYKATVSCKENVLNDQLSFKSNILYDIAIQTERENEP